MNGHIGTLSTLEKVYKCWGDIGGELDANIAGFLAAFEGIGDRRLSGSPIRYCSVVAISGMPEGNLGGGWL